MVSSAVVRKLAALRVEFEQDTEPDAWPVAAEREVTLLADVVRVLGGNERQVEQVLGSTAASYVAAVAGALP